MLLFCKLLLDRVLTFLPGHCLATEETPTNFVSKPMRFGANNEFSVRVVNATDGNELPAVRSDEGWFVIGQPGTEFNVQAKFTFTTVRVQCDCAGHLAGQAHATVHTNCHAVCCRQRRAILHAAGVRTGYSFGACWSCPLLLYRYFLSSKAS